MKQKIITIGIPAHNEEKTISWCLTAIKNSYLGRYDLYEIEIIICLSACTDNIEQIIENWKLKNPEIKLLVLKTKEKGKAIALKKIDRASRGEVLIFIDADCVPGPGSIYRLLSQMIKLDIGVVSGNSIDPRYINKFIKPRSLVEAFNHAFWQHPPRRVINGCFFAVRKGIVQIIPDNVYADDIYLTLSLWKNFIKDNSALVLQGSPQTPYEIIRYQKNIILQKRIIKNYLCILPEYIYRAKLLYAQFRIKRRDQKKYYPNLNWCQFLKIKFLIMLAWIWSWFSSSNWNQTVGSKKF